MERREFEREVPIDDRDNEDVDYDGGERWSNSKLCRVNPRCLICCGKTVFYLFIIFFKKRQLSTSNRSSARQQHNRESSCSFPPLDGLPLHWDQFNQNSHFPPFHALRFIIIIICALLNLIDPEHFLFPSPSMIFYTSRGTETPF